MVKLREEHVTVFSEQAAHQAQLAGFFGRDEIAAKECIKLPFVH